MSITFYIFSHKNRGVLKPSIIIQSELDRVARSQGKAKGTLEDGGFALIQ